MNGTELRETKVPLAATAAPPPDIRAPIGQRVSFELLCAPWQSVSSSMLASRPLDAAERGRFAPALRALASTFRSLELCEREAAGPSGTEGGRCKRMGHWNRGVMQKGAPAEAGAGETRYCLISGRQRGAPVRS